MPKGLHHLAVNQRALWSVITPAVATPCSEVFSILSPLKKECLVLCKSKFKAQSTKYVFRLRRMPMELHAFRARGSGFESRWRPIGSHSSMVERGVSSNFVVAHFSLRLCA